jgi:hypothetical protein
MAKEWQARNPEGKECTYTPEIGLEICDRLVRVGSLRKVCLSEDMPDKSTFFRWLLRAEMEEPEEQFIKLRDQYIRARELAKDYKFDELEHELHEMAQTPVIIDDKPLRDDNGKILMTVTSASVQFANMHLNAFKWQSSKENPKKYGEKVTQEHVGANGGPIATSDIDLSDQNAVDAYMDLVKKPE